MLLKFAFILSKINSWIVLNPYFPALLTSLLVTRQLPIKYHKTSLRFIIRLYLYPMSAINLSYHIGTLWEILIGFPFL